MQKNVALLGFGAIGRAVFAGMQGDAHVRIMQVLVRPDSADRHRQAVGDGAEVITSPAELSADTDCVLECAGHAAVAGTCGTILDRSLDLGLLSIGALADDALYHDLAARAAQSGARMTLLPGAIGAIDALAAAGPNALTSVSYIGRKPPSGWRGSPAEEVLELDAVTAPETFFTGTAREAARRYPKNANVVATAALAGLGLDRTEVQLVADPTVSRNTHAIVAEGPDIRIEATTAAATLPDNPRTSAQTVASALRFLRSRGHPVSV